MMIPVTELRPGMVVRDRTGSGQKLTTLKRRLYRGLKCRELSFATDGIDATWHPCGMVDVTSDSYIRVMSYHGGVP